MKRETAKRLVRDAMSLVGLTCLVVAVWLCPPLGLALVGAVLLSAAVLWQRYEWLASKAELAPRNIRRV